MKIVICGSIAFASEMVEIGKQLSDLGHLVTLPSNIESYINNSVMVENKWDKLENDVFKQYYKKIEACDCILVINKSKNNTENYIGGNALIEMAFAHILDKKIFLLNPVPNMSYTEEVEAMNPQIINGDLQKINAS